MHHDRTCQGFNAFFENPAHRRLGDRLDHFQLDGAAGQEFGGPARLALGGIRASQGDDRRLLLAIELGGGTAAWLIGEGRLQPFAGEPGTVAFDG